MTKPDPRDERIAELEARIDGLVDALVKMAGAQAYPVVIAPSPCTRPHSDHGYWYSPSYPQTIWNGPDTSYPGTVTISQSALGGTVSNRGEIGTMLPRPSPTMTVLS